MRKVLKIVVALFLTPLVGGVGWVSYYLVFHRHDRRVAMELKARSQVVGLHAVRNVSRQKAPFLNFSTTRAAWAKVCGRQDSLCGEPEGLAFAGPLLFVIVPVVFLVDAAVGVVTVPFDLVASAFRDRPIQSVSTWTVSGSLLDRSNHPMPGIKLRIVYGFENGSSQKLAGMAKASTDESGSFQTKVSAIESDGWKNSFRIDPGHLKEIVCAASQDDCQ